MEAQQVERESMEFDVVIVGAGPAGLAAAIRLKQLAAAAGTDISVCVLEKGSEVGAHILSGAVIDPIALNELIPDWRERGRAAQYPGQRRTASTCWARAGALRIPNVADAAAHEQPRQLCRLAGQCLPLAGEARRRRSGVEIYPGFACSDLLFGEDGAVRGVVAGVFGLDRQGKPQGGLPARAWSSSANMCCIAEGARGSLARRIIERYELERDSEPQKFGLGMKELWEVRPEVHRQGQVTHTMGWPLGQQDRRRLVHVPSRGQSGRRSASSSISTTRTPISTPTWSSSASSTIR